MAPGARAAFERFLRARAENPEGCEFERFLAGEDPALEVDLRRLRAADRLIEAELGALGHGSQWTARSRASFQRASAKASRGDPAGRSAWRELRRSAPLEASGAAAAARSHRAGPWESLRRALRRPLARALAFSVLALLLVAALAALRAF